MAKIVWDGIGERIYETGTKKGVLYPKDKTGAYPLGVPWNGLTAFNESPSGAETTDLYADDIKYASLVSAELFDYSIEAYTYPPEFEPCNGAVEIMPGVYIGQQDRTSFGLSVVTTLGNDVSGSLFGYKLHLIYDSIAAPSEKGYVTINDSPEAITLSWECSTTPINVTGHKPTAHLTINSTKVDKEKLTALENVLYGTEDEEPRLPFPDEVFEILGFNPEDVTTA